MSNQQHSSTEKSSKPLYHFHIVSFYWGITAEPPDESQLQTAPIFHVTVVPVLLRNTEGLAKKFPYTPEVYRGEALRRTAVSWSSQYEAMLSALPSSVVFQNWHKHCSNNTSYKLVTLRAWTCSCSCCHKTSVRTLADDATYVCLSILILDLEQ